MDLDWKTFKSLTGLKNGYLAYIGSDGKEIVVECDCQFQAAIRQAERTGSPLKLIIYEDPCRKNGNGDGLPENTTKKNHMFGHSPSCDAFPASPDCLKKFLKMLENDLSDLAKEKKPSISKSEPNPSKNKKKLSEKDLTDMMEQRDVKLSKKVEKVHGTKSERLEKLDNKTRVLLEEKRRLIEKKRQTKPKSEKGGCTFCERTPLLKKSVSISQQELGLYLPPGAKFSVYLTLKNTGNVRWSAPQLYCLECSGGMELTDTEFYLPRLNPTESCHFAVSGRVPKTPGFSSAKLVFVDGEEVFDSQFTCWARVESDQPNPPVQNPTTGISWNPLTNLHSLRSFGDSGKEAISTSQKKIEKNIDIIEKKLHDLDLLQHSVAKEPDPKKKSGEGQKPVCDFIRDLNRTVKNWEERLPQEQLPIRIRLFDSKIDKQTSTEVESDGSSDSELSILCMTQDEDNFFMVPSRSPSPAESANEEKKFPSETKIENKTTEPPAGVKRQSVELLEPQKQTQKNETASNENPYPSQGSPIRSRRSPLGEDISKPKKMKSKSTEYCFTTANLTQPTFTQVPERVFVRRGFTFTAKDTDRQGPAKFTFTGETEDPFLRDRRKISIPQMDASGKVIYAVHSKGFCLPVGELLANRRQSQGEDPLESAPGCSETQNERPNTSPAVNILPNVLMNGASNVASLAFNTAKSVISNLQSAFVTEGVSSMKTEMGQPAFEDKRNVSEDMMLMNKLLEMGFFDVDMNRKLLQIYDNVLWAVVEELISMNHKNSPGKP